MGFRQRPGAPPRPLSGEPGDWPRRQTRVAGDGCSRWCCLASAVTTPPTVEAIAAATGRSDTAFYQYFQGKLEVFLIFVEELGADLADHFAAMPVLDADGLSEVESWIEGLGHLLHKHSPVFTDWPLHTEDQPATYNPSEDYMRRFADSMQAPLTKMILTGWRHVS